MRLVVDTSAVIGEILRRAGRERFASERLQLFLAHDAMGELRYELPRRVERLVASRGLTDDVGRDLLATCLDAVEQNLTVVPEAVYLPYETEARWRSHRDPRDWPTVAAALVLEAGIWTNDADFLGTGVATWSTNTLQRWLDEHHNL